MDKYTEIATTNLDPKLDKKIKLKTYELLKIDDILKTFIGKPIDLKNIDLIYENMKTKKEILQSMSSMKSAKDIKIKNTITEYIVHYTRLTSEFKTSKDANILNSNNILHVLIGECDVTSGIPLNNSLLAAYERFKEYLIDNNFKYTTIIGDEEKGNVLYLKIAIRD